MNKRLFSQTQKEAEIELMDELLKEIDQKYVTKQAPLF
jgi:hypothetical protein